MKIKVNRNLLWGRYIGALRQQANFIPDDLFVIVRDLLMAIDDLDWQLRHLSRNPKKGCV